MMRSEMNLANRVMSVRFDRFLICLFVGVVVCLNSCSAISTFKGYSWVCFPLAVLACLVLFLMPDVNNHNHPLTVGVLVFIIPIVLSCLSNLNHSNIINSINLSFVILLAYLCVRKFDVQRLCKSFVILMCVTSAFSLILSLLSIAKIDLPLPVFENINGVHYKTIGIASQYEENFIQRSKSMGFFWESGIFASYLLLAIAVECSFEEKASKLRLSLLFAALITTYSTAGLLLVPLALSIGLLKRGGRARAAISAGLLLIFVITIVNLPVLIAALVNLNPSLFGKLINMDAVTRLTRLQSPEICLSLFFENPLFGLGYGEALDSYSFRILSIASIDSLTSTSFFQLAAFGIAGFAMWGVTVYSLLGTGRLPLSAALMLVLLFAIILNKEPHTASALTYMLVFSLLALGNQKNKRVLNKR